MNVERSLSRRLRTSQHDRGGRSVFHPNEFDQNPNRHRYERQINDVGSNIVALVCGLIGRNETNVERCRLHRCTVQRFVRLFEAAQSKGDRH